MNRSSDELAEFSIHAHIRSTNHLMDLQKVGIPPGDDLGMIRSPSGQILAGVDQVIIGRHCRIDEDPRAIGRKAMLRCLSDAAAMAARPFASLASAALAPDVGHTWATELHEGLRLCGEEFGAPLIGGDLALHSEPGAPGVISVTVLASPVLPDDRVITRGNAKPGDYIAVTGKLGGSLNPDGSGRHLDFLPRINEAIELASLMGENLVAMIDVSDGVASESRRILESVTEPIQMRIHAESVPCNDGCDWRSAIGDGEDYELLMCCRSHPPTSVLGVPVTVIGEIVQSANEKSEVIVIESGNEIHIDDLGWEHKSQS